MAVKIRDRSWKPLHLENFTGGFAFPARDDSEWEEFINVELGRDGFPMSRLGSVKYNTNSMGTTLPNGMFEAFTNTTGNAFWVTKAQDTNLYWFATPLNSPQAASTLTLPRAPDDTPVQIEQCIKTDGTPVILLANPNFTTGPVMVDGTNVTTLRGAPVEPRFICQVGQRVYIVDNLHPFQIWFSNPGDPTSWPTTNKFSIPPGKGRITGLFRYLNESLGIMTERGIFVMRGDPPLSFTVLVLHPNIGSDVPQSIQVIGSNTFFVSNGEVMTLSGAVQDSTERVRGIGFVSGRGALGYQQAWAAVSPLYYIYRFAQNTSTATPKVATTDAPVLLMILDRMRSAWWSVWSYPQTCTLGASNPFQGTCCMVDNVLMLGGGDGNIYQQPLRLIDAGAIQGTFEIPAFTNDAGGNAVQSKVRTRMMYFGDACLQKQARKVHVHGAGSTASLTLRFEDPAAAYSTFTAASNKTMPFEVNNVCGTDGTQGPSNFNGIQIELAVNSMWLKSIDMEWRATRFSALKAVV